MVPAIRRLPAADRATVHRTLKELPPGSWILLTSVPAVEACLAVAPPGDWGASVRIGVVGESTARALSEAGREPDLVASPPNAEGLLHCLPPDLTGTAVWIPGSDRARSELPDGVKDRGADVRTLAVYQTVPIEEIPAEVLEELKAKSLDAVVLASPSALEGIRRAAQRAGLEERLSRTPCITIGPTTSAAVVAAGWRLGAESEEPSDDGLFEASWRALDRADS